MGIGRLYYNLRTEIVALASAKAVEAAVRLTQNH